MTWSSERRAILIRFLWMNAEVTAYLLDAEAPTAAQAAWQLAKASVQVEVSHASFSGRELGMHLQVNDALSAGLDRTMPPENLSAFPAPGDLMYQYCPPRMFGGIDEDVFDISICYGPDTRLLMPWGWSPASRFGTVRYRDRELLSEVGQGMTRRGVEVLQFALP